MEVRTDTDWLILLDAGTGIRELGRSLMARANGGTIAADIFLTHAHWDHIQGIPFFAPIFQPGNHFTIWGSKTLETSIDRVIRDQMSPVVFPVTFEELDARIDFCEMGEEQRTGNGYDVTAFAVHHPGGALGYRFSSGKAGDASFVYVSDNELSAAEVYPSRDVWWRQLVEFIRGAKTLVHDAMYTPDEYEKHRGWGHSTYADAVELALAAGVEELVLFHHRPERGDDEVDRCVDASRALAQSKGGSGRLKVSAAAEGMTLIV